MGTRSGNLFPPPAGGWVTTNNYSAGIPTIVFNSGQAAFVSLVLAFLAHLSNDTEINLREVLNDFYDYSQKICEGKSWDDIEPILEHFVNHLIEKMPPEDKIIFKIEREDGNKRE